MKNRLIAYVEQKIRQQEKLFCAYLTLGYPNLRATEKLLMGFQTAGVDIIELGFPFSDPLADGPVIQHASECALANKVGLQDAFDMLAKLRQKGLTVPVIFFTYYNPVYHYGTGRLLAKLQKTGFDGLIIPDLPPDEDRFFQKQARAYNQALVYLAAPTTGKPRLKQIAAASQGFLYYVSLKGVTGMRQELARGLKQQVANIKREVKIPVLIGFGVSDKKQAKYAASCSDGVIVGSAIVNAIGAFKGNMDKVITQVRGLVQATKSA